MNTALMPMPRLQFSDASGIPLAGGFLFSYAAGTTTPLATYQDSLGAAANTNPIVLDSAGEAVIFLAAAAYKIVLQDLNGVVQWTQDNVSAVSQAELAAASSFSSLTVSGAVSVGGAETVAGVLTAASLAITGTAAVAGNLTAVSAAVSGNASVGGTLTPATLAVTGNETVAGTLGVTGLASLASLNVGGVPINTLITSLIPAVTAVAGTLLITNVATSGNWVIFTFGATAGTRILIAFGGGGGVATGGSIPLPSGFNTTNLIARAFVDSLTVSAGNNFDNMAVSVTGGVVSVSASDNSGHNFSVTAGWLGVAWQTGV